MLDQSTINKITALAASSSLVNYSWEDRGRAPIGFLKGMAVTYALCLQKLMAKDSAALAMVRVVDGSGDVFDHYENQLKAAGLITDRASDVDRLRILFVILIGLGMRESSGRYCCGRDTTAKIPPSSDTVEAGLFQQSWDSHRASPEIDKLANLYSGPNTVGYIEIFKEGVTPHSGDLVNFGDGAGRDFQEMCKDSPAFAVQVAAIGLRTLYTHWGPIVRHEVEISPAAISLLAMVQGLVNFGAAPTAAPAPAKPTGGLLAALMGAIAAWFGKKPTATTKPIQDPQATKIPWMDWANKEVGFHEIGVNHGIDRYISLGKCGEDGDPWCAIWINAALESSGIHGSRSAMARSFERDPNFVRLDGPAFGAITTMWRVAPDAGTGHVFFYIGENERGILALGGNQSDQVCKQYEPRNRVVGYFWPKSVTLPKTGKVIVESDADEGSEV